MNELDLAAIDQDGAVREAAATLSRGELLGGALAAAGAVATGLGMPAVASAQLASGDVSILNYALSLEYLQDSFYAEAERIGAMKGRAARAVRVLSAVERAHVRAFQGLLGSRAIDRPRFDFRGTTEEQQAFLRTAVALEDLAVEAYKAQAPRIRSREVLAAAVGIHSVEARHAAWMRHLFGVRPAVRAFDEARERDEVLEVVASTRFIVQRRPRTERRQRTPRFTG